MQKNKLILIGVLISLMTLSLCTYFVLGYLKEKSASKTSTSNLTDCLITVRGQKYNVKEFRNMHSGGDIFKCDTDMTEVFNNQHGEKELQRLQKYLVK